MENLLGHSIYYRLVAALWVINSYREKKGSYKSLSIYDSKMSQGFKTQNFFFYSCPHYVYIIQQWFYTHYDLYVL